MLVNNDKSLRGLLRTIQALFKGADKDGSGALDVKELKVRLHSHLSQQDSMQRKPQPAEHQISEQVLLSKIGILMSESDTASLMLSADRRRKEPVLHISRLPPSLAHLLAFSLPSFDVLFRHRVPNIS